MNLVGKIFVGVIAALSVVCLTLCVASYSSHRDWKAYAAELAEQVKTEKGEISKLNSQNKELAEQLKVEKAKVSQIDQSGAIERSTDPTFLALQDDGTNLNGQYNALLQDNVALNDKIDDNLTKVKANQAVVDDQRAQIETLSTDLASAWESRSSHLRDLEKTSQKLHREVLVNGDLQTQNQELTQAYDDARTVLDQRGLTADPAMYADRPKFKVKGTIESVMEGPEGLVTISIGSDDGVGERNKLDVSRGDAYLGQLEVVAVEPNRAVCKVTPGYRLGTMTEGDNVSSQNFN